MKRISNTETDPQYRHQGSPSFQKKNVRRRMLNFLAFGLFGLLLGALIYIVYYYFWTRPAQLQVAASISPETTVHIQNLQFKDPGKTLSGNAAVRYIQAVHSFCQENVLCENQLDTSEIGQLVVTNESLEALGNGHNLKSCNWEEALEKSEHFQLIRSDIRRGERTIAFETGLVMLCRRKRQGTGTICSPPCGPVEKTGDRYNGGKKRE